MRVADMFPSKYISPADLNGRAFTLTIRRMTNESMRQQDGTNAKKYVLWFGEANKGLVLNRTNAYIIAGMYGDDTDNWIGKRITIYATQARVYGELKDTLRVREQIPAEKAQPGGAVQHEPDRPIDDTEDYADDLFGPAS